MPNHAALKGRSGTLQDAARWPTSQSDQRRRRARVQRRSALSTALALFIGLAVFGASGTAEAGTAWLLQSPTQPYSYHRTTAANGAVTDRFELRSGDQWAKDAARYDDGRQRVVL